ncbi:CDF-like metal transporter [Mycena vulgaris]|nr:CDF-like metal transporter [Mycena vulgaris]
MTMDKYIENVQEEEDTHRLSIKITIYGSFIANCVLAILQICAAASSLSLSFFATTMDSVFDPMANIVLNYCHRKAALPIRRDTLPGSSGDEVLHIPSVVIFGIAFLTKLALFIYCYSVRSKSSQVRVLWEDHRNDLAVNAFGILTSSAGAKLRCHTIPNAHTTVTLIVVWGRTLYGQFLLLAGVAAPIEFQKLVIYKAMMFADGIKQIDSCSVYHAGQLDIVMEPDTPAVEGTRPLAGAAEQDRADAEGRTW